MNSNYSDISNMVETKTKPSWSFGTIAIAVAIIVLAIISYTQSEKAIKTQAIDGCLQVARLQTKTAKNETITLPENYWYEYCMKEKGFKK